jgi:hypothetical protein
MTWERIEAPTAPRRKPRRVFLWFFLAVQALFLIWVITGIASGTNDDNPHCSGLTGRAYQDCVDAGDLGATIGVGLIVFFWLAVDLILGVTYGIYRLVRRG